ncbi:S9 family peptidase [Alicyclobacillus cycloheptanicus]|uniref:Dipeptidyl aminopeptidase/acylaminoacyl peptidase n=1 Tax=Alicyclobacillus cycloheptanicus TaxID=1457 RepID=A0ABT9XLA3_9BACL|nr:S9 family peptidase [Alicyclobacillus cycloheptanicus]MDQ0190895.1 dipeptidyl aminopeptidase/acylaminoacyl peptidase [Alicyclobacillus cycloheptanicus]WDM01781.1 S9 family peptidase [Alicyclobacillus cycloheptanicus]
MTDSKQGLVPPRTGPAASWRIEDLLRIRIPTDAAVSPDGQECVFALRTLDEEKGEYRTKLWRTHITGGEPVQLTFGAYRDDAPAYSPNGAYIGFLSDRGDSDDEDEPAKMQLYILPRSGGEARVVAPKLGQVYDFAFRGDGRAVYVIVDVERTPFEAAREKARSEEKRDLTHEERAVWPKRICEIELGCDAAGDKVTTIYDRDYGLIELAPSHDGTKLVFSTNRTGLNNDWDKINLWLLEKPRAADGKAGLWQVRPLVSRMGACQGACFSPNDDLVAYIAPRFEHAEHSQSEVWLVRVEPDAGRHGSAHRIPDASGARDSSASPGCEASAQPVNLTEALGIVGDAQAVAWVRQDELLVQHEKGLAAPLYIITGVSAALSSASLEQSMTVRDVGHPAAVVRHAAVSLNGETAVYAAEDAVTPFELFAVRLDTGETQRLTDFQAEWQHKPRAKVMPFTWVSFDGQQMEGVLALPPGHAEIGKVPLLVDIHGGPAWHATMSFHQYVNWHWLTDLGYAVFAPNYRGGIGYGQDYLYANNMDLGGGDYRDIMTGVDAVAATGWVDEQRMGVMGGSYGGYMTNWIIGHDTRFQAAVSEFGIWSLFTDFGCSTGRSWETMYFGRYWENEALYLERSPSRYVTNIRTPVLIIHGDADDNTFIANSKEMYNALLEAGKVVEFVHYPREGHGIREPRHREDELKRVAAWFQHYIPTHKTVAPAKPGEWRDLLDGKLQMQVQQVERTRAYALYGDGYGDVLAVQVAWRLASNAPAAEGEEASDRTTELTMGQSAANVVFLTWEGAEPEQRPSVVAAYEAAPSGVFVPGTGTVLTGELTFRIANEGSAVLLFPATLAGLSGGHGLGLDIAGTRFALPEEA